MARKKADRKLQGTSAYINAPVPPLKLNPGSKPINFKPKAGGKTFEPVAEAQVVGSFDQKGSSTRTSTKSRSSTSNRILNKIATTLINRLGASRRGDNGIAADSGNNGSFSTDDNRTSFYDSDSTEIVKFDAVLPAVTHLNEMVRPSSSGNYLDSRLHFNLCSVAEGWMDASNRQLRQSIFADYSRDVIAKVRNQTTSVWTQDNFDAMIYNSLKALEYYYTIDSILSFKATDNTKDGNKALELYAGQIDSFSVLSRLASMRRLFRGVWLPPRLSQLTRWLYQNYKSGPNEQSSIIRFLPNGNFVSTNTNLDPDLVAIELGMGTLETNIQTDNSRILYSLLSDIYPWGRIEGLPKSCNFAIYDANFLELFANQPCLAASINTAGEIFSYPSVTATNTEIPYFVNSDPSKGTSFAFTLQDITSTTTFTSNTRAYTLLKTFVPGTTIGAALKSNKYSAIMNGELIRLTIRDVPHNLIGSPNLHSMIRSSGDTFTSYSAPQGGIWQRVYFNNSTAPGLLGSDFIDYLFGLN